MRVKICPTCGFKNPANRIFCVEDQGNLENVAPTDDEAATPPPSPTREAPPGERPARQVGGTETRRVSAVAQLVGPDSRRFLIAPGVVIGRPPLADIDLTDVPNSDTISRAHARFTCDKGQWHIEVLTDTNASFIDNSRVHRGERVPVRNGARVTLGEATFLFQAP